MLAVIRPALAVLLLVGTGVAAVAPSTIGLLDDCVQHGCSFVQADDELSRIGGASALASMSVRLSRPEEPPLIVELPAPPAPALVVAVLDDAPKTSPPG